MKHSFKEDNKGRKAKKKMIEIKKQHSQRSVFTGVTNLSKIQPGRNTFLTNGATDVHDSELDLEDLQSHHYQYYRMRPRQLKMQKLVCDLHIIDKEDKMLHKKILEDQQRRIEEMERAARKNETHPMTSNAMFYTGNRKKVVNQNKTKLAMAGKNTWQQQPNNKIIKSLLKKQNSPTERKQVSFAIGTGTRALTARERNTEPDKGLIPVNPVIKKRVELDQSNISHNQGFVNDEQYVDQTVSVVEEVK